MTLDAHVHVLKRVSFSWDLPKITWYTVNTTPQILIVAKGNITVGIGTPLELVCRGYHFFYAIVISMHPWWDPRSNRGGETPFPLSHTYMHAYHNTRAMSNLWNLRLLKLLPSLLYFADFFEPCTIKKCPKCVASFPMSATVHNRNVCQAWSEVSLHVPRSRDSCNPSWRIANSAVSPTLVSSKSSIGRL